MASLKQLTKSLVVTTIIALARTQIGTREVRNTNLGERVEMYQQADTLAGEGYAWCASFIAWLIRKAMAALKIDIPWSFSAACRTCLIDLDDRGLIRSSPAPGDVVLFRTKNAKGDYVKLNASHIGLVTKLEGNGFWHISGNTNATGAREGFEVRENFVTNVTARHAFGRWVDGIKDFQPTPAQEAQAAPAYTARIQPFGSVTYKPLVVRMHNGSVMIQARQLGETLGKVVDFKKDLSIVTFDGDEIGIQPQFFIDADGQRRAYFWVRDLVEFFGWGFNLTNKVVSVSEKH